MRISALFAGIAGVELGFHEEGHSTLLFCEIDPGARAVLKHNFGRIPIIPDIRDLASLPRGTDIVTAGFPCQDLSQAGGTKGINGDKSGIVSHLFRLLRQNDVPHLVIENVPFMLQLKQGEAINYLVSSLEELGYRWAYRVVNALSFGLPQRRERVYLLASKKYDPWNALFVDEAQPVEIGYNRRIACGFYWTEGTRGLGWAVDAVPTLKGGSTIGIPSPPAIWMPNGRIVKPGIRDAERLQGFPKDWTLPVEGVNRKGHRWKLVGNAVSVRAARWVGRCIKDMEKAKELPLIPYAFNKTQRWPSAAFGSANRGRFAINISKWPKAVSRMHLADFVEEPEELSYKAVAGFIKRLTASSLRYPVEFLEALDKHKSRMNELGKN